MCLFSRLPLESPDGQRFFSFDFTTHTLPTRSVFFSQKLWQRLVNFERRLYSTSDRGFQVISVLGASEDFF